MISAASYFPASFGHTLNVASTLVSPGPRPRPD